MSRGEINTHHNDLFVRHFRRLDSLCTEEEGREGWREGERRHNTHVTTTIVHSQSIHFDDAKVAVF